MFLRPAAMAAWIAAGCAATAAWAADPLTLEDAFARVGERHPELRLLDAREAVLATEREIAIRPPPLVAGLQAENILGSGTARAFDGAELTFSLASVLERGGKRDARRLLAQSRIDALEVERQARRLDLLAEVARRYLAASAATHARDIAAADIAQRSRAVEAARERWRAGASPEALLLSAQAAHTRAELARARAQAQWVAARQHLAILWAERAPDFEIRAGDPLALPDIPDTGALETLLAGTPELGRFATGQRVAEARLQLARSAMRADVDWQVGVRGLDGGEDVAFVAGVQIPLGARRRTDPEIRGAQAELAMLDIEREGTALALHATLLEAHGRYTVAQLEVARLRDEVLPALLRAEAAAERAWRAGASAYQEWAQLQSDLTDIRRQQLDVAIDAQRALIEIQRLTGQAFVDDDTTGTNP